MTIETQKSRRFHAFAVEFCLALVLGALMLYRLQAQEASKPAPREINYTIMNLEYQGTKIWIPSVLIAPKDTKINLKLINNAPSGVHGFSIPDFKVQVSVAKGKPEELSFIADKAGLFPINCHLHPAHIGGQLMVY